MPGKLLITGGSDRAVHVSTSLLGASETSSCPTNYARTLETPRAIGLLNQLHRPAFEDGIPVASRSSPRRFTPRTRLVSVTCPIILRA